MAAASKNAKSAAAQGPRARTRADAAPAGYELVPIPIHEDAANAALDELKGAPAGFVRAVRLLLTRQHAVFVVQAEGGDEHAIHRARGVVAALYAFDAAVEHGADALDGRIGLKPKPAAKRKAVSP